ncbi:hypothetical protein [Sphingomonas sp. LaA6.9]|uniref:hypothetical protein n=1 Tax=Sphingomonas sp. LaA6.9 TaxID=2919914 RepID=UPI001F4F4642|nr:hypothetical protein [Sphingomonas sp. LaA6.9]MCJ8156689.1 hypothetical protein [Sphingomonas sp. LaA6.9]
MEDLNYLYHRQQVSLMRAHAASDSCSRRVHEKLAHAYGDRIARFRCADASELTAA